LVIEIINHISKRGATMQSEVRKLGLALAVNARNFFTVRINLHKN